MEHLMNFKTYRNSAVLEGYLSGDISEEEYFIYFDGELNEGLVGDFIGKMVGTVKNTLLGFLEKAIKTGSSIVDKVIGFMKKIKDKVLSFHDKHPILFKIIMILLMTFLILIMSCVIAHAATTGNPIDENILNLAIGFLDDMKTHGYLKEHSSMDVKSAMAYLMKLRNHQGDYVPTESDVRHFGKVAIDLAEWGIERSEIVVKDAKSGDKESYKFALDCMRKGSDFVKYEISMSESGMSKGVKLYTK
jgi:hypothetical protein